jgi:hypothetical protein
MNDGDPDRPDLREVLGSRSDRVTASSARNPVVEADGVENGVMRVDPSPSAAAAINARGDDRERGRKNL